MEHSKVLAPDLAEYRRKRYETGSPDYQYLLNILGRHISLHRERINNQLLSNSIGRANTASRVSAPAGPASSDKKQRPCRFHNTAQGCRAGADCPFTHTKEKKSAQGQSSSSKGNGKGKSRSRSPSAGSTKGKTKRAQLCLKYAIGQCTKTAEECIYQHRKATADEKEAIEKFKAKVDANKAKAKAKAKSTPSSPRAAGTKKTSAAAIIPLVVMAAMTRGAMSLAAQCRRCLCGPGMPRAAKASCETGFQRGPGMPRAA